MTNRVEKQDDEFHPCVEFDDQDNLTCPFCGTNNLHHETVTIFSCGQDKLKGVKVTVENGEDLIKVEDNLEGNPSKRRHGLTITFSCEHCEYEPILALVQHKGSTYMRFIGYQGAVIW